MVRRPPSCWRFTRSGPPSCEASSSRRLSSSSSFCQSMPGARLLLLAATIVAALRVPLAQELDELLLLFLRQGVEPAPGVTAVVTIGVLGHVTPPPGPRHYTGRVAAPALCYQCSASVSRADWRGCVGGVARAGTPSETLQRRVAASGIQGYTNEASPVGFWDL